MRHNIVVLRLEQVRGEWRSGSTIQRMDAGGGGARGEKAGGGIGLLRGSAQAAVPDVELIQGQAVIVRVVRVRQLRLDDQLVLDRAKVLINLKKENLLEKCRRHKEDDDKLTSALIQGQVCSNSIWSASILTWGSWSFR